MLKFDLIRDPWIPCVFPGSALKPLGIAKTLSCAHEIAGLADESPLVVAALHRLLLAILHRLFGPRDAEVWGALWRGGQFPSEPLEAYWERWQSRFDLFDGERPFFQCGSITANDEPRSISSLEFHRASGNNATLFDHTTDSVGYSLDPSSAARALVAHQTFSLGGPVGYLKSGETDADKRGLDAPAARGAITLVKGGTLFQTLMLNLCEYDPAACSKDLPSWERDHPSVRGQRTPMGRVDLFTWQSRRIRLFPRESSDGKVQVERVKIVPGDSVPQLWQPFHMESLQVFTLKPDAEPQERAWFQYRVSAGKAAWRDSEAILFGSPGKRIRSLNLGWLAELVEEQQLAGDFRFGVEVLGASTDRQKVDLWRKEGFGLAAGVLRDEHSKEQIALALRRANEAAKAIWGASKKLAEEILAPNVADAESPKRADSARVGQFIKSLGVEQVFWGELQIPYSRFLWELSPTTARHSDLDESAVLDAIADRWSAELRRAAKLAFRSVESATGISARGVRAFALAEAQLHRGLSKIVPKPKSKPPISGVTNGQ